MNDIETRRKKLPVLLFIRGEQYFDDVDPDATELTTEGTLELTEKGLLLTYQETALTGMEGTTTTFEVSGPQVILRRVGSVNSQMVFEAVSYTHLHCGRGQGGRGPDAPSGRGEQGHSDRPKSTSG